MTNDPFPELSIRTKRWYSLRMRLAISVLLLLSSYLPGFAAATGKLSIVQIQQIADSGTPGLALQLLDEQHPGTSRGFDEWFRWSKARTDILVKWRAFRLADGHLQSLPADLPEPLQRWALAQRAWLRLELGDAEGAAGLLRDLVWRAGSREQDPTESALWRRLLIRGYLLQDRVTDAAIAMNRYQQDYASDHPGWIELRARILLRQNRPLVALEVTPADAPIPEPLRLLAVLRADPAQSNAMRTRAHELLSAEGIPEDHQARLWVVVAEASHQLGEAAREIVALENALRLMVRFPLSDRLFHISPTRLWAAYAALGSVEANALQLLVGDDIAWFDAVQAALAEDRHFQARGLLAVLAEGATSPARRDQAQAMLAKLLSEAWNDMRLVDQLYRDSVLYPDLRHIPQGVRELLVEQALADSDIVRASELLSTLDENPANRNFDNRLRRARVLVMGGHSSDGSYLLNRILDDELFFAPEQYDQFMQVLFDLQSAEQHEVALQLFYRIEAERQIAAKSRRELFFWIGESLDASADFDAAALYFMRSATYTDARGDDLWGQSARYRAGEALAKAGLLGDARRVYESLLAITSDPARQSVLRTRLQQLWVLPAHEEDLQ